MPQHIIDIPAPELQGDEADQYELVTTKDTCRLAQQPGSYVVLMYRKQAVLKVSKASLRHRHLHIYEYRSPAVVLENEPENIFQNRRNLLDSELQS